MKFRQLEIPGAYLLEPDRPTDRRGFFARGYCRSMLERRGLDPAIVRCEISVHHRRGALRAPEYQAEPYGMARLVRCTAGKIYHVLVDLRRSSKAFRRPLATELDTAGRRAVYIPTGVAHGFQTLEEETEVFCQMSEFHHPECVRKVRWDDPELAIEWPLAAAEIS